jgi:hypothetical protein
MNSIIIPAEGFEEFKNLVVEMVELSKKVSAQSSDVPEARYPQ